MLWKLHKHLVFGQNNLGHRRVAENFLRLRELVIIISKQKVIIPEKKLRALLS